MEKEPVFSPRPERLLEALGIDFRGLSDEEREMKKLLIEEYGKRKKVLLEEVRNWRESHPEATLGAAIRALYGALEENE